MSEKVVKTVGIRQERMENPEPVSHRYRVEYRNSWGDWRELKSYRRYWAASMMATLWWLYDFGGDPHRVVDTEADDD